MLMLQPERVLFRFLQDRTGVPYQENMRFIGWGTDTEIKSVAGFYDYTGHSVFIHLASTSSFSLYNLLPYLYDYVFNQLHCKVVFTKIENTNLKALRLAKKLKFEVSCMLEEVYDDHGITILKLRREEDYGRISVNS